MSGFAGILIVFGIIIFSMMLHELAHGYVAYLLGDDTAKQEGRLTLNPLKHLDPVLSVILPLFLFISGGPVFGGAKPVPINTRNLKKGVWGMALVALAGPLTNFLLAFIGFLVGHFSGLLYGQNIWGEICGNFIFINLGFGIFNLIPIPPLDGSRVLYAFMPDEIRRIMAGMETWGMFIVLAVVLFASGLLSNLMSGAMTGILQAFYWIVGIR